MHKNCIKIDDFDAKKQEIVAKKDDTQTNLDYINKKYKKKKKTN